MIEFKFKVGKEFLKPHRKITVPGRFKTSIGNSRIIGLGSIRIICPDGTTLRGNIYSSYNNAGLYYQMYVNPGSEFDPLGNYEIRQRLIVKIFENSDYIEIREG